MDQSTTGKIVEKEQVHIMEDETTVSSEDKSLKLSEKDESLQTALEDKIELSKELEKEER